MTISKIQFTISGCDATTYIEVDATPEEAKFLNKIIELSDKRSTYSCMPTIALRDSLDKDSDWEETDV